MHKLFIYDVLIFCSHVCRYYGITINIFKKGKPHTHIYIHSYTHINICIYYIHTYIHICIYIHTLHIHNHMYKWIYNYPHSHVCFYEYMYAYTDIHKQSMNWIDTLNKNVLIHHSQMKCLRSKLIWDLALLQDADIKWSSTPHAKNQQTKYNL